MAKEIEKKYLVKDTSFLGHHQGQIIRQGYIPTTDLTVVRIRVVEQTGYLTVKGKNVGITRPEYEYVIPVADAQEILTTLCPAGLIEKTRYKIPHEDLIWEVDVFHGDNQGLVVAEIELESESTIIKIPEWVGRDVSTDFRYTNAYLAKHPYTSWEIVT